MLSPDCAPVMDRQTGVHECPDGTHEPSMVDCDRCHGIEATVSPCDDCQWHDDNLIGDEGCMHPAGCEQEWEER